jgi:ubiquitin-protein ligase
MYYQGSKYNIPVAVWLGEEYPRMPPIVYVEPTPDMIIKPRHTFVNASGSVDIPYLRVSLPKWTSYISTHPSATALNTPALVF